MRKWFRKKNKTIDPTRARFDAMVELIQDLDDDEYNRLTKAMRQAHNAYMTISGLDTPEDEITKIEAKLDEEE